MSKTVQERVFEIVLDITWEPIEKIHLEAHFMHDLQMEGRDSDELEAELTEEFGPELIFERPDNTFLIDKYKTVGDLVKHIENTINQ